MRSIGRIFFAFLILLYPLTAKFVSTTLNVSMVWKFYGDKTIDYADLSLLIPQNSSHQRVIYINISEPYLIKDNKLYFHFENVTSKKIYGNFVVNVDYINYINKLNETTADVNKYLKSSKLVILDSKIGTFSNNFSGDFPSKIISVLDWISNNIEYAKAYTDVNISDIIDTTMPSDWVFTNRKGVCDEFSTLFIAIMRSIGIPARAVSGFAFVDGNWIPHAWAEIYIEPYGWIEVDPTFNEFMNLDAGRIRIGSGVDHSEITDRINITSKTEIKILKLESYSEIDIIDSKEFANLSIETVFPYQEQLSNVQPMLINLKNFEKEPIYTKLSVIYPEGVSCNCTTDIFLKSGEEYTHSFILNLPQLSPNVKYTFPLIVLTDYKHQEASFSRIKIEKINSEKDININETTNMKYFIGIFFIAMVGLMIIAILRGW